MYATDFTQTLGGSKPRYFSIFVIVALAQKTLAFIIALRKWRDWGRHYVGYFFLSSEIDLHNFHKCF